MFAFRAYADIYDVSRRRVVTSSQGARCFAVMQMDRWKFATLVLASAKGLRRLAHESCAIAIADVARSLAYSFALFLNNIRAYFSIILCLAFTLPFFSSLQTCIVDSRRIYERWRWKCKNLAILTSRYPSMLWQNFSENNRPMLEKIFMKQDSSLSFVLLLLLFIHIETASYLDYLIVTCLDSETIKRGK